MCYIHNIFLEEGGGGGLCLKENLQLGFVYFCWQLVSLSWYYPEFDIPYAIISTEKTFEPWMLDQACAFVVSSMINH